jgi:hypothetical protein
MKRNAFLQSFSVIGKIIKDAHVDTFIVRRDLFISHVDVFCYRVVYHQSSSAALPFELVGQQL